MQLEDINELDFKSWFDHWHTHFDWGGEGNDSWGKRQEYLDQMLQIFESLKDKLKQNKENDEYQVYCYILPEDSSQDALYIHTKNPNQNNYPAYYENHESQKGIDKQLLDFLEKSKYEWFIDVFEGIEYIILYDKKYGVPPIKNNYIR